MAKYLLPSGTPSPAGPGSYRTLKMYVFTMHCILLNLLPASAPDPLASSFRSRRKRTMGRKRTLSLKTLSECHLLLTQNSLIITVCSHDVQGVTQKGIMVSKRAKAELWSTLTLDKTLVSGGTRGHSAGSCGKVRLSRERGAGWQCFVAIGNADFFTAATTTLSLVRAPPPSRRRWRL